MGEQNDLGKSWVFVKGEKQTQYELVEPGNSAVQEIVAENGPQDSDTDSISVISESACSVRSDDDESSSSDESREKTIICKHRMMDKGRAVAIIEDNKEIVPVQTPHMTSQREKITYFVIRAFCAFLVIGFSLVVEWYVQDKHQINVQSNLKAEPRAKNILQENDVRKFSSEMLRDDVEDLEAAVIKKSDYLKNTDESGHVPKNKLHKSRTATDRRGNDDLFENCQKFDTEMPGKDDNYMYKEKFEELKAKEDYLREKEKFLVRKEHDLLQKQIKFDKDMKKQHDKRKTETTRQKKNKETFKGDVKNKAENSINKKHQKKNNYQTEASERRNKYAKDKIRNENISGQWYIDMHEARKNMRERKRFTSKSNKSNWYFRWMFYRARLRDI